MAKSTAKTTKTTTKSKKATTSKSGVAKKAATEKKPSAVSKAAAAAPKVKATRIQVSMPTATVSQPELKKPELINMVVEKTGAKKKDAKPIIEAVLSVMGAAVADGRELNLVPFGKMKQNRTQTKSNGRVIVAKIRQPTPKAD